MENIILKEAFEIIKECQSKNTALRIALFGPPESGKTDFLLALKAFCDDEIKNPVITFYFDLKEFPTNSINDFYHFFFKRLENVIKSKQIKIDRDFPSKWDTAFENLIEELLKQTASDIYFFIDHIDTISGELARILVSRFKEFDDKVGTDDNYKRFGLCVAGIKTLFDLRREFLPSFVSWKVIKFPRQDKNIQNESIKNLMRQEFTDEQIIRYLDALRELSGGERAFVLPLLEHIGKNPDDSALADISELLNNSPYAIFEKVIK